MKRLTGLDASFLYLETPSSHMHVGGIAVFDPTTAAEDFTFDSVLELTAERLHLVPAFRQRLATVPFELHHPLWVDDPHFDLEYHVRKAALPAPGDARALADFAADVMSRPLDRTRPLWEMYIVEGLEDGHVASVTKTHHSAIDGVSGADLTVTMLDLTAEPVRHEAAPWTPERIPSELERVGYAVGSLVRQPPRVVRALWRTGGAALNPGRVREPNLSPPPAPFRAPRTSINGALTARRSFSFAEVPLDEMKAVKNALGGTVNDVVLAVCAGALRRYFDGRGEELTDDLVAMVPISVRSDDEKGDMGNRVSSMLCSLATRITDPVERLHAISEGTKGAKQQHNAMGADTMGDLAEFAPPAMFARAARLYSRMRLADRHRPIFNLVISNVPGPSFPLYSFGARMVASYPMGPLSEGSGLNITVTSYMGSMFFGFVGCRELVDDIWLVARSAQESFEELTKALL